MGKGGLWVEGARGREWAVTLYVGKVKMSFVFMGSTVVLQFIFPWA